MALKAGAQGDRIKEEVTMDFTPMIDVTFQLLIFFMLTIKFKTLDGKLSTLLPLDVGISPQPTDLPPEPFTLRLRVHEADRGLPADRRRVVYSGVGRVGAFATATAVWDDATKAYRCEPADGLLRLRDAVKAAVADAKPEPLRTKLDVTPDVPADRVLFAVDLLVGEKVGEVSYTGLPSGLVAGLESGAITSSGR